MEKNNKHGDFLNKVFTRTNSEINKCPCCFLKINDREELIEHLENNCKINGINENICLTSKERDFK